MGDEIYIRKMTFDDQNCFNFILEQYALLITTYQPRTNLPKAILAHKHFVEDHINNYFVVTNEYKRFVGCFNLILQKNYYLITDMFVKSDDRSKGYGRLILEKCKSKARFDGKDLRAIVDKTNVRGARFFEKNNFELIGQADGMFIYQLALIQQLDENEEKKSLGR